MPVKRLAGRGPGKVIAQSASAIGGIIVNEYPTAYDLNSAGNVEIMTRKTNLTVQFVEFKHVSPLSAMSHHRAITTFAVTVITYSTQQTANSKFSRHVPDSWSARGAAKMARIILKKFTKHEEWDAYWKEKTKTLIPHFFIRFDGRLRVTSEELTKC